MSVATRAAVREPALLPWRDALRRLAARRSVIACYHGVGPTSERIDPLFLRVPEARFARQLDLLDDAGFAFVTVAELAARAAGGAPPPGLLALSFDDGMDDNHDVVRPMLRDRAIPATVYVATGLVGQPNPWLAPESGARMMGPAQLRVLAAEGWELGAHTITHPDLGALDQAGCLAELAGSRDALLDLAGVRATTCAYPFGSYGPAAVQAAADAGFAAAVTTRAQAPWQALELPRSLIWGKDGIPSFTLKLAGTFERLFESGAGRAVRGSTRELRRRVRGRRG